MMTLAVRDLAALGADLETIPGRTDLGDCVRARLPHPRAREAGVLILGHLDTVHPIGTLEKLPWRRDGSRCYGPGILDMKGGNFLALEALSPACPCRDGNAAAGHRPVHERRGDRQPFDAWG